jgi:hypothetical protein
MGWSSMVVVCRGHTSHLDQPMENSDHGTMYTTVTVRVPVSEPAPAKHPTPTPEIYVSVTPIHVKRIKSESSRPRL